MINPDAISTKAILVAFSDESGCFNNRFQSIGIVSGQSDHLSSLRDELRSILARLKVKEVHFEKVRSHTPMLSAACYYVDISIKYVVQGMVSIDVLCWDTQDSRHDIRRRDDVANLERMYFKILRNVAEKWRQDKWYFFPDKGSKLNWAEITSYLNNTRLNRKPILITLFDQNRTRIKFLKVTPRDSIAEPLVQLADLFAGIVCFSARRSNEFLEWQRDEHQRSQQSLFSDLPPIKLSRALRNRFLLITKVYLLGKKHGLQISLPRDGYLRSFKKTAPLNIWHYHPKGSYDKAPVKRKRS